MTVKRRLVTLWTTSDIKSTSGRCRQKLVPCKRLFPSTPRPVTGKPKRHKGYHSYSVLTVNGRVRLVCIRWHCFQDGSETPTDRLLDEVVATINEVVREMACRLKQNSSSFQKSASNLARVDHLEISKESLRKLVEEEGKTVLHQMQRAELIPEWSSED